MFESDGVSLGYDDTGASGLPAITFLHGLSMARSSWAPFVPDLEGRFRVVRLDQRGHGESSHAPGTYVLDTYVADTVAFLEAVVAEPAVLVGHSLGGVIAHAIAQRRADLVRAVLLEDPPLYVVDRMGAAEQQSREQASAVAAFFPVMQGLTREMQGRNAPIEEYEAMVGGVPALNGAGTMAQVLGPDGTRAMAESFSRLDPDIFTAAIDGSAISGSPDHPALACPAVVLRADPALGPAFTADDEARFLKAHPHARVVVVEGASHAIHDEQPNRFLDELLALTASVSV